MTSPYNLGDEPDVVKLPSPPKSKKAKRPQEKDLAEVEAAATAGEVQGFVDRSPDKKRKLSLKPGRKRTEEQDRITIPGPKRVIDRLRIIAKNENVAVWRALEMALDGEADEN